MTGKQLLIIVALVAALMGYGVGWMAHAAHDSQYIRQQQVNSYNQGFKDACEATGHTVC